jgi:hypothetical protein
VDATGILAKVMLPKCAEEVDAMADLCRLVSEAANIGLKQGRPALYRALRGAFPVSYPVVSPQRVHVAVRRGGLLAEARIGPGQPSRGDHALEALTVGARASQISDALPPGVEIIGIGRSYEPPLIREGRALPDDLELVPGAVLAVRWDSCGVTVAIEDGGPRLLSDSPREVAR